MAVPPPVRVAVVDAHRSFVDALALVIPEQGFEYAGGATTLDAALPMIAATRPDVILMDLAVSDGETLPILKRIMRQHPKARVLILSGPVGTREVAGALAAGAAGFLSKEAPLSDILDAVSRRVTAGFIALGPGIDRMLRDAVAGQSATQTEAGLTGREREILQLLADGRTASGIAAHLHISVHTCRGHIKSILLKLGAHTQLEAVVIATRSRLIHAADAS